MGELLRSREYLSFRASVPQKKVCVDDDGRKEWTIYDVGGKTVRCPLVCLPPVSGRADVYFKQLLALSAAGYRVISVEYPTYWNCLEFCEGFVKLIDHLNLDKVHIFGSSIGGFLAQKVAEYTSSTRQRVVSIVLCNAFTDTRVFEQTISAPTFWMMPALVLKTMVMGNFDKRNIDADIVNSIDFLVNSLDSLGQSELASRLTLNCRSAHIEPHALRDVNITVIDVNDDCALSQTVKDEIYRCFPAARRAHLKSGGNFPYLSRSDEVNVYLQIHLREYASTPYNASDTALQDIAPGQQTEETCIDQTSNHS